MKRTALYCCVAGLCVSAFGPRAFASDSVTQWNDAYLDAIRASRGDSPAGISRRGAMISGAIYDTINAFEQTRQGYAFTDPAPASANRQAAIAAAGYRVMIDAYGHQPGTVAAAQALYQSQLAAIADGPAKDAGIAFGQTVGNVYVSRRAADVPLLADNSYTPGGQPGDWRPSPPNNGGPVGVHDGDMAPWTLTSNSQFRPVGPPALTSAEYTAAYNDVRSLGSATSATRTVDQTNIAYFWANDRDGTSKPLGHLNAIARTVAEQQFTAQGLTGNARESAMARLLAITNIAMADAGIAAWDCKYNTPGDLWRPSDGINLGDTDGNADTIGDASWVPLSGVVTEGLAGYVPGFPAYISGHATFGAVQAAVMRNFFGTDNITFTIDSEDPLYHAGSRTYTSFTDIAQENGRSRVYLGVHWNFDSTEGYTCGTGVGNWAYDRLFQVPTPGAFALLAMGGLVVGRRRR